MDAKTYQAQRMRQVLKSDFEQDPIVYERIVERDVENVLSSLFVVKQNSVNCEISDIDGEKTIFITATALRAKPLGKCVPMDL